MKSAVIITSVVMFGITMAAQATDPMAGTWKLDVARSHYSSGAVPKAQTTIFETIPHGLRAISTTLHADGKTTRIDTVFLFDGKDYEVLGTAVKTTRAYSRPDERHLEWTAREDGKTTTKTISELSADGNSRTVTTTGHDAQGRTVNNVQVYDRVR